MMLRLIGAGLIIASCGAFGFGMAAQYRREISVLRQFMSSLEFMQQEMAYHLSPLPELCRMAAGETKGILRVVFMNLYRELKWQQLPDAGSCMYAAIQRSGEMPARVRRLLVQLGQTLGRFDLSGQLQGIRAVQKRCEETLEMIRKNRDERLRSYQTLGVCAGAALAIILV